MRSETSETSTKGIELISLLRNIRMKVFREDYQFKIEFFSGIGKNPLVLMLIKKGRDFNVHVKTELCDRVMSTHKLLS